MIRKLAIATSLALLLGCAEKASRPLPGDSVSADGGVTLSPPRLSTPTTAPADTATGPIEARLFPPELAMERQEELGITDEQKRQIIAETERGNSEVLHLQWELEAEKEKLVKLLEPEQVNEALALEASIRVTDREGKVKQAYLTMLVRVKNILTPEQKERLRAARKEAKKTSPTPMPKAVNDAGVPRNPSPKPVPKSKVDPLSPDPPTKNDVF